jgi:heme-degrading monooxygenase HmoA
MRIEATDSDRCRLPETTQGGNTNEENIPYGRERDNNSTAGRRTRFRRITMIAVIFEVTPKSGATDEYLEIAGELKGDLATMDGFISIERFQSLTAPDRLLSLSFWRDEDCVTSWRNQPAHRDAQIHGQNSLFSHYRLRVAHVLRDYGMGERQQAATDPEK